MLSIGDQIRRGMWGYILGDCVGREQRYHCEQVDSNIKMGLVMTGVWSRPTLNALKMMDDITTVFSTYVGLSRDIVKAALHDAQRPCNVKPGSYRNEWYKNVDHDVLLAVIDQYHADWKRGICKDDVLNSAALESVLPLTFLLHVLGISDYNYILSMANDNIISHKCCEIYEFLQVPILNGVIGPLVDVLKGYVEDAFTMYYLDGDTTEAYFQWFTFDKIMALERSDILNNGLVTDTLKGVLYCLTHTSSYEECVVEASMLGNDSSTIAALAGGLAGLYYGIGGENGIPRDWIPQVCHYSKISGLMERLIQLSEVVERDYVESETMFFKNSNVKAESHGVMANEK